MKKIFTLCVAVATLLSAQAVTIDRAQFKQFRFPHTAQANVEAVAANLNGTNFNIVANGVAAASADVTFTPNVDSMYWYYNAIPVEYYDSVTPAYFTSYLKYSIDNSESGIYIQYGLLSYDMFLPQGALRDTLKGLEPNTEYVVMAWGIEPSTFTASTPFDTIHIHTLQGQMSDNQISLAYNNGTIAVTTTNNDPYFFIIEDLETYQQYESDFSQASLKDEARSWISSVGEYLSYFMSAGNQNIDVHKFYTSLMAQTMPDGDYIALVCGHNGEYITTPVAYAQFAYVGQTAVDNVNADVKAVKTIQNGQIVIEKNGVKYNMLGTEIK